MTTHVYFDGGTKNGTTRIDPPFDGDLYFQAGLFDKEERYLRTDEIQVVDGVTYTVFRFTA
ncbi:hypothetical protein ACFWJT_16010 [Streptomyces sp. NPDC127069]|uniref:hypothetical protein n=1 Tax=Streptomyces sp. NPDC127069 TaxID=3347128 RepID=UPI0036638B54